MVDRKRLKLLLDRQETIRKWLSSEAAFAVQSQKHLDIGSAEQAYWHYGYFTALSDLIEFVTASERTSHTEGKTN